MIRILSRLRRLPLFRGRIPGRVSLLLLGALLVLAVSLFCVFHSVFHFKPVTTPEDSSLPEEFLSPFDTKVGDLLVWLVLSVFFLKFIARGLFSLLWNNISLKFRQDMLYVCFALSSYFHARSTRVLCSHPLISTHTLLYVRFNTILWQYNVGLSYPVVLNCVLSSLTLKQQLSFARSHRPFVDVPNRGLGIV